MVHALEPDAQAGSLGTLTPEDLVKNINDAPSGHPLRLSRACSKQEARLDSSPGQGECVTTKTATH